MECTHMYSVTEFLKHWNKIVQFHHDFLIFIDLFFYHNYRKLSSAKNITSWKIMYIIYWWNCKQPQSSDLWSVWCLRIKKKSGMLENKAKTTRSWGWEATRPGNTDQCGESRVFCWGVKAGFLSPRRGRVSIKLTLCKDWKSDRLCCAWKI